MGKVKVLSNKAESLSKVKHFCFFGDHLMDEHISYKNLSYDTF